MARGALFMSAAAETPSKVIQHIFNSDGTKTERMLDGEFGADPSSPAIVLPGWVRLAMRKVDERCSSRENAEECPIVRESLQDATCLRDYVLVEPRFET